MTTIVWDATSRTLATDSREVWDDHLIGKSKKLYALDRKNCWIAVAGPSEVGVLVVNDLNKFINSPQTVLHSSGNAKYKGFAGVLIYDSVPYAVLSRMVPMPIYDPHFTLGTGGPYALAALKLGKTAKEAVQFASQFDNNTDEEVQLIQVPATSQRKRK